MAIYECDCCGRKCSRIHHCVAAGGTDTSACDDCYGYEWEAYDEDPDPLLAEEGQGPSLYAAEEMRRLKRRIWR